MNLTRFDISDAAEATDSRELPVSDDLLQRLREAGL